MKKKCFGQIVEETKIHISHQINVYRKQRRCEDNYDKYSLNFCSYTRPMNLTKTEST